MTAWPIFLLGVACGMSLGMALAAVVFEVMRRRRMKYIDALQSTIRRPDNWRRGHYPTKEREWPR